MKMLFYIIILLYHYLYQIDLKLTYFDLLDIQIVLIYFHHDLNNLLKNIVLANSKKNKMKNKYKKNKYKKNKIKNSYIKNEFRNI